MSKMRVFTDQELANYVVCPQAWYLKSQQSVEIEHDSERAVESRRIRQEWHDKNSLLGELHRYRRAIYLLLLGVVAFLTVLEVGGVRSRLFETLMVNTVEDREKSDSITSDSESSSSSIPFELVALLGIVGIAVFVYDRLERHKNRVSSEVGFNDQSVVLTSKERESVQVLTSAILPIIGKPDTIIEEQKQKIPVIFQAFGKKVQDRHVIRLIAYQYMLREAGESCDYGVLVLGQEQRRVEIRYNEGKREWLESILEEMKAICAGRKPVATPSKYKCRNCDVRGLCSFRYGLNSPEREEY